MSVICVYKKEEKKVGGHLEKNACFHMLSFFGRYDPCYISNGLRSSL